MKSCNIVQLRGQDSRLNIYSVPCKKKKGRQLKRGMFVEQASNLKKNNKIKKQKNRTGVRTIGGANNKKRRASGRYHNQGFYGEKGKWQARMKQIYQ